MGCLRTFLAITVLLGHSYGYVFTGAVLAVQIFYVISGFLISFVLTEAGHYDRVSRFYLNRALRLFPVYWVVALGTLVSLAAAQLVLHNSPPAFEVFGRIDPIGKLALVLSNILIIGQDWIMFTGVQEGAFRFVGNFRDSEIMVWRGLLVPPAWTLGVELSFYAIAPFVLLRPRLMAVLLACSVGLRVLLVAFGPGQSDPWSYRFFPTELALFLAGALSHRYWMPWLRRAGRLSDRNGVVVTILVLAACLAYQRLPDGQFKWVVFLVFVGLALPFLFQFQKRFRWDRRIGELSYPVYIAHWSILFPLSALWDRATGTEGYTGLDETAAVLALTIGAALLLNRHVARRVETLRKSIRTRPAPGGDRPAPTPLRPALGPGR